MEISLFHVILGITGLFFILLFVKSFLKKTLQKEFCIICVAVSLGWVSLLVLSFLGLFLDKILLALLMGHTSLGIFYLWEEKVSKKYKLFRLPLLLTLIVGFYSVLGGISFSVFGFLFLLWILFLFFYFFKNNRKMNHFVNKLVECCREI